MERLRRDRPLIMGILNVTPDSFFDGGRFLKKDEAIAHALKMAEEGADIIDVGGESTRPFSDPTPLEEELRRVVPVIEGIRKRSEILISIDTYKAKVALEAVNAGANIINDISGLTFDEGMINVARRLDVPVVIMHIKGKPKDMQEKPYYENVISEIKTYFEERIKVLEERGLKRDRIILDPGIGFGKRVEDNLKIIKYLGEFKTLELPILIGPSMKSFIGHVTESPLEERLYGTLASIVIALLNGADIVRVHDVKSTLKVLKLVDAVMKA